MTETYCGKICAECAQKAQLNCPGCKDGPGGQNGGDCPLAQCVRNIGYETCDTCGSKGFCRTLRSRDRIPDIRIKKIEVEETRKETIVKAEEARKAAIAKAEEARKAAIAEQAPFLSKWLGILFWFAILSIIGSILSTIGSLISSAMTLPWPFMLGEIVGVLSPIAYGAILMLLGSKKDSYRTAGICTLIAGCASAASDALDMVFYGSSEGEILTLILTLSVAIVALVGALVGKYKEYMTHSEILRGIDNELSEAWKTLWKWHIRLFLCMSGGLLLFQVADLGAFSYIILLAFIFVVIGLWVVKLCELTYLHRTTKLFRKYDPTSTHNNDTGTIPDPGYPVTYPVPGGSIIFNSATGNVTGFEGEVTEANIPAEIEGTPTIAIGDSAFRNCSSLTSITIPSSVAAIGDYAFSGCYSLKDIYYGGSENQWEQFDKSSNDINGAVIHYSAEA